MDGRLYKISCSEIICCFLACEITLFSGYDDVKEQYTYLITFPLNESFVY